MRKPLLSLLAILAIPTAVFAYYSSPSELLMAASLAGKPVDFAYEAHGSYEDMYASVWMKGSAQGKKIDDATLDMRATADVALEGGQARMKVRARVKDQILYFLLESLEGSAAEELEMYAGSVHSRQWYAMPLDDLQEQGEEAIGITDDQGKEIAIRVMDAILRMDRVSTADGSVYSIKLKRNAAAELRKVLTTLESTYPELESETITSSDIAELRKIFARTQFHVKVITDKEDALRGIKFYAGYKERKTSLVVQGDVNLRSTPVAVQVPANAQMLDESLPNDSSL